MSTVYDRKGVRKYANPYLQPNAPRDCYCPLCAQTNNNKLPKKIRFDLFRRHFKKYGEQAMPQRAAVPLPLQMEVDAKQAHPAIPSVHQSPGPLLENAVDEHQQELAATPAVVDPALVQHWYEVPDCDLPQDSDSPEFSALNAEIQIIFDFRRALCVHAIKNPQNPQKTYIEVCRSRLRTHKQLCMKL